VRKGRRSFDEPPPEDDWTPPADRDEAAPPESTAPKLRVVRNEPAPAPTPPPSSAPPASVPAATPEPAAVEAAPEPAAPVEPAPAAATLGKQGPAASDVRRLWPEVLEEVKRRRRFTWMTISQHAQVTEVSDGTLVLTFANPGARDSFLRGGSDDVLRDALVEVMGADLTISALLESEGRGVPAVAAPAAAPVEADSPDSPDDVDPAEPAATTDEWRADPDAVASSAHTDLLTRARAQAATPADPAADTGERDDPDVDDADAESLLREMLHAEVIDDE
jgi:DNA polymerase-3 subunit gamma/tau